MKIQLVSDLHLEFFGDKIPLLEKAPGAEVLIMAGDVCLAKNIRNYTEFFRDVSKNYEQVYYVPGNHEHYGYHFESTYDTLHQFISINRLYNVHLLKAGKVEHYKDFVFIGDTLWTDCNGNDPTTKLIIEDGMNDYQVIRTGEGYRKLRANDTVKQHVAALVGLEASLNEFKDKKVILVTHHGMSPKSTHPRYATQFGMNGGYITNLEGFINKHPNIVLAVHGHVHNRFSYMVGTTRVEVNPRGYPVRGQSDVFENSEFEKDLIIDV